MSSEGVTLIKEGQSKQGTTEKEIIKQTSRTHPDRDSKKKKKKV